MEVSNLNSTQVNNSNLNPQATNNTSAQAANNTANNNNGSAAVYEGTNNNVFRPDMATIQRMLQESNNRAESLRQLVERLMLQQGVSQMESLGLLFNGEFSLNPNSSISQPLRDFFSNLQVDDATRSEAQGLIAEDGYFGVQQTAERLLAFARALSGGDPSRIDVLRDAVVRGFEAAERAWGGQLPEISQQTLNAVMRGFDEWAASATASTTA